MSADQTHAWASVLSGMTGEQIAIGLNAVAALDEKWPPSATEFKALCRPTAESFGLPSAYKAYREATNKAHPSAANAEWSHAAVYHAATETGFHNLNTLKEDASRKIFERNYAICVRMVIAGEPLKALPLALPETVDARCTPEVGRAALAELRKAARGEAND
ncbi:replication protein P [uncultured Pseudomonas sp.]|uniref:replication protein P n=1 Tax=uncultured Pseudomonas sp. TaxID=114707 RepID=UPI0030DABADF